MAYYTRADYLLLLSAMVHDLRQLFLLGDGPRTDPNRLYTMRSSLDPDGKNAARFCRPSSQTALPLTAV